MNILEDINWTISLIIICETHAGPVDAQTKHGDEISSEIFTVELSALSRMKIMLENKY